MLSDYSGPADLLDARAPRAIAHGHLTLRADGLGSFAATLRVDNMDPALITPGPARLIVGTVEFDASLVEISRLHVRLLGRPVPADVG